MIEPRTHPTSPQGEILQTTNDPGERGGRIHLARLEDGTFAILVSWISRETAGAGYWHRVRRYCVHALIGSGHDWDVLTERFEHEYETRKKR